MYRCLDVTQGSAMVTHCCGMQGKLKFPFEVPIISEESADNGSSSESLADSPKASVNFDMPVVSLS